MQYPCPCLSVNAASMASKCARTQPKSLWKHTAYPNREVHVHMFWCRELAQQVAGEARNLRGVWGLRVAAVFGGADKAQQVKLACRRRAPQPAVGTHRQRPTVVARAALAVLRARLMNALRSCVQVELLGKKPHVLVATPGRLLDLADSGRGQPRCAHPSTHMYWDPCFKPASCATNDTLMLLVWSSLDKTAGKLL